MTTKQEDAVAKQDLSILIRLHRVADDIDRQTAHLVKRYDLTLGQFAVLEALYHKGDCTVGQVQRAILSSSGTVPIIVGNLERRGLLERRQDAADKRRWILHLSDAGRTLIAQVFPENERLIEQTMECWTLEEKRTLSILLKKYGDHHE